MCLPGIKPTLLLSEVGVYPPDLRHDVSPYNGNNTGNIILCLEEKTESLRYENQPVNAVKVNNRSLLCKSNQTHKYTL